MSKGNGVGYYPLKMPFSALELLHLAKEARKGFVFELGANFFTKIVPFK